MRIIALAPIVLVWMRLDSASVLAAQPENLAHEVVALLRAHPFASRTDLIKTLYQRALNRPPVPQELASARQFLGEAVTTDGLADLLWSLLMLPEFQLIR